jgi:hypothetical protein
MDFLNQFLASLLDRFKADSPKVWAAIALLLITVQVVLLNGVDFDLWTETPLVVKIAQVVNFALALFVGSKTVVFLPAAEQKKRIETAKNAIQKAA